jgi:hypothetical protein
VSSAIRSFGHAGDGVVEALSSWLFQLTGVRVVPTETQAAGTIATIEEAAQVRCDDDCRRHRAGGRGRLRLVNLHDTAAKSRPEPAVHGTNAELFRLEDDIYDG